MLVADMLYKHSHHRDGSPYMQTFPHSIFTLHPSPSKQVMVILGQCYLETLWNCLPLFCQCLRTFSCRVSWRNSRICSESIVWKNSRISSQIGVLEASELATMSRVELEMRSHCGVTTATAACSYLVIACSYCSQKS